MQEGGHIKNEREGVAPMSDVAKWQPEKLRQSI